MRRSGPNRDIALGLQTGMGDNLLRGGERCQRFLERSAGFAAGAENAINETEDNGGLLWVSHYGPIIA